MIRINGIIFWEKYLIKKNIKCWNIHSDDDSHLDLQNRTNNALERYNRSFNDKFSSPHPSLLQFVTTIEEESRFQVRRLNDIRDCDMEPPKNKGSTLFEPPLCWTSNLSNKQQKTIIYRTNLDNNLFFTYINNILVNASMVGGGWAVVFLFTQIFVNESWTFLKEQNKIY